MKYITFVFLPILALILHSSPTVACEDLKNSKSKAKTSAKNHQKSSRKAKPVAAIKPVSAPQSNLAKLPAKPNQAQVSKTLAAPKATASKIATTLPAKGRSPAAKNAVKTLVHRKTHSVKTTKVTKAYYFVPLPPKKTAGVNTEAQKRTTSSVNRARVESYFKKDRTPIQPESDGDGGQLTARLVPTSSKVGTKHSVREE